MEVVCQVRAGQLDLASRCEGWTIRQVLGHSLGVTHKFADFASGVTDEPHAPPDDVLSQNHVAAAEHVVAYAHEAWSTTDMSRTCRLRFGTFSAEAAAGINLFDVLAHSWDVAASIRVALSENNWLWLVGLHAAQEIIGSSRDPQHYAAARPVAAGAPPMHRFLAYLGRSHDDSP